MVGRIFLLVVILVSLGAAGFFLISASAIDDNQFFYDFDQPSAIAIDSADKVYIADTGNNRIMEFDGNGKFVAQFGYNGSGGGQLSSPTGVAVDGQGNVYVADSGNSRVVKFNNLGKALGAIGKSGSGDSEFGKLEGIALDPQGNLYAMDSQTARIQKFDSNGRFLLKWGSSGSQAGQFLEPVSIAVSPNGIVHVGDKGRNDIQKFDATGKIVGSLKSADKPGAMAFDRQNNLFVSFWSNQHFDKYAESGALLLKQDCCTLESGLAGETGLTVDSTGYIYLVEKDSARVVKRAGNNNVVATWEYQSKDDLVFISIVAFCVAGVSALILLISWLSSRNQKKRPAVVRQYNYSATSYPPGVNQPNPGYPPIPGANQPNPGYPPMPAQNQPNPGYPVYPPLAPNYPPPGSYQQFPPDQTNYNLPYYGKPGDPPPYGFPPAEEKKDDQPRDRQS